MAVAGAIHSLWLDDDDDWEDDGGNEYNGDGHNEKSPMSMVQSILFYEQEYDAKNGFCQHQRSYIYIWWTSLPGMDDDDDYADFVNINTSIFDEQVYLVILSTLP